MAVTIEIDEGPRFTYGAIEVKGDLIGSVADNLALLRSRPNDTFSRATIERDRNALEIHYQDLGYAHANVALPAPSMSRSGASRSLRISRGKRAYFERINIRGNTKTRDKVIRREMQISEGELFNNTNLEVARAHHRARLLRERRRLDASAAAPTSSSRSTSRSASARPARSRSAPASRRKRTSSRRPDREKTCSAAASRAAGADHVLGSASCSCCASSSRTSSTRSGLAFDLYNQSRGFGTFYRNASGGTLTLGLSALSDRVRAFLTYKLEDVSITTGSGGIANLGATARRSQSTPRTCSAAA